jgi:hypothetical protein
MYYLFCHIKHDLIMRIKYTIMTVLLFFGNIVWGQDSYFVTRNTYLKKNPDAYSDNISFIPEGTMVYKLAYTDYPYLLVKYNGEDGYVNRLDLSVNEGTTTTEEEILPQEPSETVEPQPTVESPEETENGPSGDIEKKSWKDWLVLPKLPSISSLGGNDKYIWFLLIIPLLFLSLLIRSLLGARKRKEIMEDSSNYSSGNQESTSFWDQKDRTIWEQPDKNTQSQQEKTTFDNTYSEPIKVHRWENFTGKDDKTIFER